MLFLFLLEITQFHVKKLAKFNLLREKCFIKFSERVLDCLMSGKHC